MKLIILFCIQIKGGIFIYIPSIKSIDIAAEKTLECGMAIGRFGLNAETVSTERQKPMEVQNTERLFRSR